MTDDETTLSVLKTIAQALLEPAAGATSECGAALSVGDGVWQPRRREGELARAALDLPRQDPAYAEPIPVMSSQAGEAASRQCYVEPTTIVLKAAALLALQTRVKFKLDSNHKWSIEIDKISSSDAAVKLLVQRLPPFLGK